MASTFATPPASRLFASPWRLFGVFGLFVLLPFGLFAWLALSQAQSAALQAATVRNEAVAQLGQHALQSYFTGLVDYVDAFSRRHYLAQVLAKQNTPEIHRLLQGFVESSSHFDRVLLTSDDGALLNDYPIDPAAAGRNYAEHDWYKGVRTGSDRPYLSRISQRLGLVGKPYVVAIAAAVRDDTGRVLAYVVGQYPLDALDNWLGRLSPNADTRLLLADQDGRSYAPGGKTGDWHNDPVLNKVLSDAAGGTVHAQGEHLVSYETVAPYGWTVAVSQDDAAIYAPLSAQRSTLALFAALMLLVLIPMGYLWFAALLRQRQATEASRSLLAGILDSSDDATVALDLEGRLMAANATWVDRTRQLLGAAPAVGKTPRAIPGVDLVSLRERAVNGEVFSEVVGFEDGPMVGRSFEIRSTPLLDHQGQHVGAVMVSREVTAWLAAEHRISRLNTELAQRNHALEEVNRELEGFCYSVSHDLRAPLRAVDGFAGLLIRRASERLDEEDMRLLGVVRDNSKRMGRLIDDLLVFARMGRQALAVVRIDMEQLVADAWQAAGAEYSGDITVGPLPPVTADRALLKQVWVNLLSNAVKYTGRQPCPRIEVHGEVCGAECRYSVRDNGAGFDMRYVDKLFGVFQRLHGADEFPGTGVGLAIVARVVGRHGGRAWAEGTVGVGASFHFSIPTGGGTAIGTLSEEK